MSDITLKDVLINARQESYRMRNFYLGVEHLFIALLEIKGSMVSTLLEEEGLTPEYVIDAIRRRVGKGSPNHLWAGMPNTPRADVVLGIANDLALENGREEIVERDLLAAIFSENDSIPVRVLRRLGLDVEKLAEDSSTRPSNNHTRQPYVLTVDFGPDFDPTQELSDGHLFILRRMFYGYSQIRIERRLTGGYTQALILVVTPIHEDNREDAPLVVKMDYAGNILDEALRYETHVKNILPPLVARLEDKPTAPETSDLAGLKYTFVGEFDKPPQDMRVMVRSMSSENLSEWLRQALYNYFGRTLWQQRRSYRFQVWMEYDALLPPVLTLEAASEETASNTFVLKDPVRRSRLKELEYGDIVAVENFTVQRVYQDRDAIQLAIGKGMEASRRAFKVEVRSVNLAQNVYYRGEMVERIVGRVYKTRDEALIQAARALDPDFDLSAETIPGSIPPEKLPNPLTTYDSLLDRWVNGSMSKIHGDLHLGNILVGPNNSAFLIDFAQAREGHTVFDWATLELSLLSEVVMPVAGESWSAAREVLPYIPTSARGTLTRINPALARAMNPVIAVRNIVGECLEAPNGWSEYYVALALCALRAVTWDTMPIGGRRLMFLVAALAIKELHQRFHKSGVTATDEIDETDVTDSG
jgi:uncharacterized protein associated with vWA-MoxR-VMAP ternary system/ClpA/ClpB-like protein